MDAHYDQVMRARAALTDAPARLYFAYSTILDRAAFEEWRSQHGYHFFDLPPGEVAEARDLDLVFDFPSRFWGGRVAGLVDRAGAGVYGRVFQVAGVDWPIIRHKEGYITGMCVEREVTLRIAGTGTGTGDGERTLTATAFTTHPDRRRSDGPVSARFVEAMARGAESAGLPAAYLTRLRDLGR